MGGNLQEDRRRHFLSLYSLSATFAQASCKWRMKNRLDMSWRARREQLVCWMRASDTTVACILRPYSMDLGQMRKWGLR